MCSDMNGEVFKISEASVGENYPPLHPNCRSGTQIVFPNEINQSSSDTADDMFREVYEAQMAGLESEGWRR